VSAPATLFPLQVVEREEVVGRWRVRLTSYRLGAEYLCVADDYDPGANIGRGRGPTREAAEAQALAAARERLARTVLRP
jgi:hypothetical protein